MFLVGNDVILKGEKIVFGGFTLSHYRGETVFVERLLPGEIAKVRIKSKRAGVFYGEILEIIEQSPKRSQPLCKHYVDCGGCSFQHMDYESQLQEKSATTAETISRLAGIVLDNIYEGIVKSPVRFMYRNKMEFSVLGNIEFSPALHRRCRFDNFVATPYCLLPLPEIMELTKTIYERFTKLKLDLGFLPIYIVALRESFATKEIIVNIVVNKNEIDKMGADYSLIEDKIRGVVFENLSGLRNLASGWVTYGRGSSAEGEPHLLWGNETIVESFCGKRFLVGPASFLQVNPYMAEILYRTISEFVGETKVRRLLDLYSGLGVIGIILSAQVDEVVCVESNEESVKLGQKSALLNGCKNVKFICDDVYRALSGSMARNEHFDIVVVDPPRMGIAKKALEKIIKLQPTKIIYISCNPSTMARDIKMLGEHYRLSSLIAFDMFPQTYHIECLGLLEKGS